MLILILVLNRVSDRIGNRWRDMARNLDIREFDIDALDAKYPRDLKEKAYQVNNKLKNELNSVSKLII